MRIAIDIDSTLHHYWNGFAAAARHRFGVDLPYGEQTSWEIAQLRSEQVRAVIAETHRDENVLAAEPYPGAVEVVGRWHAAGHFIHVTSHRAEGCHVATSQWLDRIGLSYDELYCSYDKITRCVEIGIDVLIDDSPRNVERALEHGITPVTLRHPWNRDVCEEEGIVCADSWPELAAQMEPLLSSPDGRLTTGARPRSGGA